MVQPSGIVERRDTGLITVDSVTLQVSGCEQTCFTSRFFFFLKGYAICPQGGTSDLVYTQLIFIPNFCFITQNWY